MQVKTFEGSSSQAVLEQVKESMGPEAIILSSKTVKRHGKSFHTVTAGVERPMHGHGSERPYGQGALDNGVSTHGPSGWDVWHKEWSQVKEHLYALMQPAVQWDKLTPRQRVALEYLQRDGVEESVIMEMYQNLSVKPGQSVLELLSGMCKIRPWTAKEWPERVHIMTGPAGVGKTMTALRMVLALRSELPDLKVAFINADCSRGASRLVLRHFSELSDFSYAEAVDAVSMSKVLREASDADCIFLDMPALAPGAHIVDLLESYEIAKVGGAVHLALSPHYGALQIKAFMQQYLVDGLSSSLVWTKLDEAISFGALLNVATTTLVPISGLSFGSELRGTYVPAQDAHIWRLMFKHQLPGQDSHGKVI